ncbi:hypothetical protein BYI23_A025470 [Burkholderia sp. YI23]|nr:hypothetical protein BYI23_A025470 [Burkholderia sp. YI23]
MLDDVLCEDDDSEHVAYASALGFDFKVVATPRQIDIEDDADEIRIEIVENDLEFVNRKMTKTKWKAETSPRSTEVRAQGRGVGTVRLAISRALATYQRGRLSLSSGC